METTRNKKVIWVGRVLSWLLMPLFAMSAFMKFTGGPEVVEGMTHLGIPQSLLFPLGLIEVLCIVIYLIPITSVLGAILFTGYMGGAILAHVRIGEPVYTHVALGMAIWLGVYLRDPRLRALLPFRRTY